MFFSEIFSEIFRKCVPDVF